MSEKLTDLVATMRTFVVDKALMRGLEREKNQLEKQVISLARFNYAREPELTRDRLKLRQLVDEVSQVLKRLELVKERAEPVLMKLRERPGIEARALEEKSEEFAQQFLSGKITYDVFTKQYIGLRKETSKKRLIADRANLGPNLMQQASPARRRTSSPLDREAKSVEVDDDLVPPPPPPPTRPRRSRGSSARFK